MKMKGVGFANVKTYVLANGGEARWAAVCAALGERDRQVVQEAVAVGWYDVYAFARLLRAIDAVCGSGDLKLLREVGRHEAEQDMNRALRMFLRVLAPSSIFKAEARIWSHFQDSGKWRSVAVPGGMDATLTGWAVDVALCEELAGYLVRLVEFTGGRHVRVTHEKCRARGADHCVYCYRWI